MNRKKLKYIYLQVRKWHNLNSGNLQFFSITFEISLFSFFYWVESMNERYE